MTRIISFIFITIIISSCNGESEIPDFQLDQEDIENILNKNVVTSSGYEWLCLDSIYIEECKGLDKRCGEVCEPYEGFEVVEVTNETGCTTGKINALDASESCELFGTTFTCSDFGGVLHSSHPEAGEYSSAGIMHMRSTLTKYYCKNTTWPHIRDLFPPEVNLILD